MTGQGREEEPTKDGACRTVPAASEGWILAACGAIVSALLPLLGAGMFFRNEAAVHLLQLQQLPLWEMLQERIHSVNFRPTIYLLWYLVYELWGVDSAVFLALNGIFHVASMLAFFLFISEVVDRRTAFLSVVIFQLCFSFTLHCLFNAVYGLFYPVLWALFFLGAFLVIRGLRSGSRSLVVAGVIIDILAGLTHSFALVLIPGVVGVYVAIRHWPAIRARDRVVWILLASLALMPMLLPFVQSARDQVPLDSAAAAFSFVTERFSKFAEVVLKPPSNMLVPLLLVPVLYLKLRTFGLTRVAAGTCAFGLGASLWGLAPSHGELALLLLLVGVGSICFRDRSLWWLGAWFSWGLVLYLITDDMVAAYVQPSALALSVLLAMGAVVWLITFRDLLAERSPVFRYVRFHHLAVGTTVLAALGFLVVVNDGVRVPVVSRQLYELAHVKALGRNLEGVLMFLRREIDEPTEVVFIAYREEGEEEIYSDEYVARLPPVKYGYDDFLRLYGIEAQPSYIDLAGGDPPSLLPFSGKMIVAMNEFEMAAVEGAYHLRPFLVFDSGRAKAAIYRVAAEDLK